jgi:signal transduction histidine kinase/ligand-binding sensor domain-containing protein
MVKESVFHLGVRLFGTCALGALTCTAVYAQDARRTLAEFEHTAWTIRDGAPAYVAALAQTADGFLWLGTSTGLYRFDGVRFEAFTGPPGYPLPSTNVCALLALPDGTLWIGYRFGGASLLGPNSLTSYGERDGLPGGTLWQFVRDSTGTVWAASNRGLARLDGDHWTRIGKESGLSGSYAAPILVDRRGTVWVATDSGVFALSRRARKFETRLRSRRWTVQQAIREAPDGSVWSTVDGGGLMPLSDATGGPPPTGPPVRREATGALFIDDGTNAWISVKGGMGRLSLLEPRGATPAQRLSRAQGLSGASVYALLEDRERNVWVGTEGGIDRFRPTKLRSVPLSTSFTLPAIAAGDDGTVWMASWSSPPVHVGSDGRVSAVASMRDSAQCAYRDQHGVVWLGGATGLWRLQGSTFVRVEVPTDIHHGIQAIAVDGRNRLWLSVVRKGVYRRTGRSWEKIDYQDDPAITIVSDGSRGTWLGYTNNRLVRAEGNTSRTFTTTDGLRVGNVLAIHLRGNHVWIGGERGLAQLSRGRVEPLTGADGDAFRGSSGIVETGGGELWLNGAGGVTRIGAEEVRDVLRDPTHRVRFERLDFHDGLEGVPSQIRPLPTAIEGTDGRLWFVTGTAVMWLDPRRLLRNRLPPPVQIQSLASGDSTYAPRDTQTLPIGSTSLQIRYTALSLSVPEHVRFHYQLGGSDAGWIDAGTRREAFYTNLRPGTYHFRVSASNEDGVWNDAGTSIDIVIPPTFVQTGWFLALCTLAAAVATWLLYRLRVRRVASAIRARFDATLAERTRIARELHDTLLQEFTGITLHLQAVQGMLPFRPVDAATSLSLVLSQADTSLREARDVVWDMRTHELDAQDLPGALTEAVRSAIAGTTIQIRLSVYGESRRLPRALELTTLRIAREAIANAVKHADARHLEIVLSYTRRDLQLRVRDDGRGLLPSDEDIAPHDGHWGIVGMRERATRIGGALQIAGALNRGTVVSLSVPMAGA